VDADLAREQLAAATKRKTASDEEFELRDRTINQARGQLRVAKRTR
jgi:hypothetical protein